MEEVLKETGSDMNPMNLLPAGFRLLEPFI